MKCKKHGVDYITGWYRKTVASCIIYIFYTQPPVGSGDLPYQRLFVGCSLVKALREKQMELHRL